MMVNANVNLVESRILRDKILCTPLELDPDDNNGGGKTQPLFPGWNPGLYGWRKELGSNMCSFMFAS